MQHVRGLSGDLVATIKHVRVLSGGRPVSLAAQGEKPRRDAGWLTATAQLVNACEVGDAATVRRLLLSTGTLVSIDGLDSTGTTPLHAASAAGHCAIVRFLLGAGAGIEIADGAGLKALHVACRAGRTEVVRMLLKAGANAEEPTSDGTQPWQMACVEGHAHLVDMLMSSARRSSNRNEEEAEVLLHVYSLGAGPQCDLASVARALCFPCARRSCSCGLFHTAIEVHGDLGDALARGICLPHSGRDMSTQMSAPSTPSAAGPLQATRHGR